MADDKDFIKEANLIDDLAAQLPEELPYVAPPVEAMPVAAPIPPTQFVGQGADVAAMQGGSALQRDLLTPDTIVGTIGNQFATAYDPMLDPATGGIKPQQPITTIKEGGLILPTQHEIKEKVGETRTTEIARTPQLDQRIKEMDAAKKEQADQAQKVLTEMEEIKAKKTALDEIRSQESQQIAMEAQRLYDTAAMARQNLAAEINQKRQDLAAMKPETFWGSKTAADKIMLAMSVGLGAWGQAEIGGQNIGLVLLQRNMDEHDALQKQRFSQAEKELSLLQNYSVQSQQAINNQFTSLKALEIAQKDKLETMLGALESKVSTESARLKVVELKTKLQIDTAQKQAELERDLAKQTARTDFITKMVGVNQNPRAPIQANGQPMDVSQRDKHGVVLIAGQNEHVMTQLENANLIKTDAFNKYYQYKMRHLEALANSRTAGEVYYGFKAFMDQDPELLQVLGGNSDLQAYDREVNQFLEEILRGKTGAAIAAGEFKGLFQNMIPLPPKVNQTDEARNADLAASRRVRRNLLTTYRDLSNSGVRFEFAGERSK